MIRAIFVGLIRLYQLFVSPLLLPRCRFYPTCSNFAIACFTSYPLWKAIRKTVWRLCCCHPWHPGGIDLP